MVEVQVLDDEMSSSLDEDEVSLDLKEDDNGIKL